LVNAKAVVQLNHTISTTQNHRMQEIKRVEDSTEQEAVKEYVDGLENNIEYFKEWSAIYKTQRDLARGKVSQLEMRVMQLQEVIRQLRNGAQ
jgi:aminoglycoside N3'-acetyltransferase